MWYEKLIKSILDTNADVLFVVDPNNLLNFSEVKNSLKHRYSLDEFQSEIGLRRILRCDHGKYIVKFKDINQIPYDLLSSYANIAISVQNIFSLLNIDALSSVSPDHYQEVYEKYCSEKGRIYDRLSYDETKTFLDSLIFKENLEKRERSLILLEKLNEVIPAEEIGYNTWGYISGLFGELNYLIDSGSVEIDLTDLKLSIQQKFKDFVLNQYQNMVFDNETPLNSNILHFIFEKTPTALICFDCMGFEEWNVLKDYLKDNMQFNEKFSFSMLPSDTGFSRTALFSGKLPLQLNGLSPTDRKEEKLFKGSLNKNFKIEESDIYFKRCVSPDEIPENYAFEDFKAVGIIFSFIDEFVHGKNMNKSLVIALMEKYLVQTKLDNLIKSLLDKGFSVYLSSDHGNVFATGNGKRPPKNLFNSRSRRYLKSEYKNIIEEYLTEDSFSLQLKDMLDDDYLLLLNGDSMFNSNGHSGLTHGGSSIEEVVIPFIEVNLK